MSTPTHSVPLPHAAKHATPSNTAATPRSVPSPALHRQHASSLSAKQSKQLPASVPMSLSLSQASNTSGGSKAVSGLGINNAGLKFEGTSPSNAHLGQSLSFASPAGMMLEGLSMSTPGLGDPGSVLAGMGGVGMDISLSSMGINIQERGKRDEDEERRKKLRSVLDHIGGHGRQQRGEKTSRMGRISDEGVRRIGRWSGLDVVLEAKYEGREWEGNRPVVIAGRHAVLIDIAFSNNLPKKVEVTFDSEDETVTAHAAGAAQVLKNDLTVKEGVSPINARLDAFANNLERLARLDRLSSPSLKCIDAITGLYTTFKALYDHGKETAKVLLPSAPGSNRDYQLERHVMCKQNGRPGMHTGGRVGLSIDYWQSKRVPMPDTSPRDSHHDGIHALELTVEPSDPSTFPSLRISRNWLSERIIKPVEESADPADLISGQPIVDWLEPAPTLVRPVKDGDNTMAIDAALSQPNARFVARLHPPVVVPYMVATQVLQASGLVLTPPPDNLKQYERAVLQLDSTSSSAARDVVTMSKQHVFVPGPDLETDRHHLYNLSAPKVDFSYTLNDIAFSHPRQIIMLIPTLRQWASFGSLLQSAFKGPTTLERDSVGDTSSKNYPVRLANGKRVALDSLVDQNGVVHTSPNPGVLSIDITITTTNASPTMNICFPFGDRLGSVTFTVEKNGEIIVTAQDIATDEDPVLGVRQKMARALQAAADIGIWAEWMRSSYG